VALPDSPLPCLSCAGLRPSSPAWRGQPGLDVELAPGGLLAIVGPSGSGKSSLLRAMAGMEQPLSGEVFLNGRPAWSLPAGGARPGVVGPHHRPFPEETVPAELALDVTGLTGKAGLRAGLLDQVESHLLVLARELGAYPRLVVLDDPYRDVPAAGRTRLASAIASARERLGSAFVYACRAADEISGTATRQLALPAARGKTPWAAPAGMPFAIAPFPPFGATAAAVLPAQPGPVTAPRWLSVEAYLVSAGDPAADEALRTGALARCRDAVLVFRIAGGSRRKPGPARRPVENREGVPPAVHLDVRLRDRDGGLLRAEVSLPRALRHHGAAGRIRALVAGIDSGSVPAAGPPVKMHTSRRPLVLALWTGGSGLTAGPPWVSSGASGQAVLPVLDRRGGSGPEPGAWPGSPYAYLLAGAATPAAVAGALDRRRVVAAIPGDAGRDAADPRRRHLASAPRLYGAPEDVLAVYAVRRDALAALNQARGRRRPDDPEMSRRLLAAYWGLWGGNYAMVTAALNGRQRAEEDLEKR